MLKVKSLIFSITSSLLLTSCFGSTPTQINNFQNTKISNPKENIVSIGGETLNNEDIYAILKQKEGKTFVQNWIKINIVKLILGNVEQDFDNKNSRGYDRSNLKTVKRLEADGISKRIDIILQEQENKILFPKTIEQLYTELGYKNLLEYKINYLRALAYEEIFNEIYIKENVSKLFEQFQPRKVWAIKFGNVKYAEKAIKQYEKDANIKSAKKTDNNRNVAWAKQAMYRYKKYLSLGKDKYENQQEKQIGLSGVSKSSFLNDEPSIFDSSLVGLKGYLLKDNSDLPAEINTILFDKYISYDDDPEKISKGYFEDDTGINENEMLTFRGGKKYYVEKSNSIWVIRTKVIREIFGEAHEELNWVETKKDAETYLKDYNETLRSIGKISSIVSKAQTTLFNKYAIKVFDEELWLQISGSILDNKENKEGK